MTKRLILIATAIMTTVLFLVILWQFRVVIFFVLTSLVLSATFRPIAQTESESRQNFLTRLLGSLKYIVALIIIGVSIYLVGGLVVNDLEPGADGSRSISASEARSARRRSCRRSGASCASRVA
jgi:predicted PurR-regulated permease PerM